MGQKLSRGGVSSSRPFLPGLELCGHHWDHVDIILRSANLSLNRGMVGGHPGCSWISKRKLVMRPGSEHRALETGLLSPGSITSGPSPTLSLAPHANDPKAPLYFSLTLAILQGTTNWMLGMGCVAWLVECLPGLPKALGSVFSIA